MVEKLSVLRPLLSDSLPANDSYLKVLAGPGGNSDNARDLPTSGNAEVSRVSADASEKSTQGAIGADLLSLLVGELGRVREAAQTQTDAVQLNTEAVLKNASGQSTGSRVLNGVKDNLFGGWGGLLGAVPLVGNLFSLFKHDPEPPPALPVYTPPPPVSFDLGLTQQGRAVSEVDRPTGLPRAAGGEQPVVNQFHIQVQALDSRSILDRSHEIAQAVRQAMLSTNGINDVFSEL